MKESAYYIKIVEWLDEDNCFVGQCPGIIGPCCHGDDEVKVYAALCQIVDEWIETMKRDGKALPLHTAGINAAGKIMEATSRLSSLPLDSRRALSGPASAPE